MRIGIMGAMPQEIDSLGMLIETEHVERVANRSYHVGRIMNHDVVIVFSRWGKVAAASTVTTLIERFSVDLVIFTGVAGGAAPDAQVGDVVIASSLIQHDFDASATAMFARFEIPLLGIGYFPVEQSLVALAADSARRFLRSFDHAKAGLASAPSVHIGIVASGDQFIASAQRIAQLRESIPGLLSVEMEGAAVAQVCHEHSTPYLVIRTISDKADSEAPLDFLTFVQSVARVYSEGIILDLLANLTLDEGTKGLIGVAHAVNKPI